MTLLITACIGISPSILDAPGGSYLTMITDRDLGIGVTIDVENVPLSKKYTVAVLLGVALCEQFLNIPLMLLIPHLSRSMFVRIIGIYIRLRGCLSTF